MRIAETVIGVADYDVSKIPLNRRQRKRLVAAGTIVVHLFSGKNVSKWTRPETGENGLVILNQLGY